MKNSFSKFILLSVTFIVTITLSNNLLNTNELIRHFLSDYLTIQEIKSYFEINKKWQWLSYFYIPLILLLKTSVVSLIIYIAIFLKNKDLKIQTIWNNVLNAEFIFILVPIFKTLWFLLFQNSYTFTDIQNFYPLSALNITGYKNLEPWYIYPLQTLNLFELAYIIYLGFQIGKLTNTNADYGLRIIGISYVPALLLWVTTVMFFTLNYS